MRNYSFGGLGGLGARRTCTPGCKFWGARPHGERGVRTYGAWGGAPSGRGGRAPCQAVMAGGKGPEGETLSAFGRSMDAANLVIFLKFANAKNHIFVVFLAN